MKPFHRTTALAALSLVATLALSACNKQGQPTASEPSSTPPSGQSAGAPAAPTPPAASTAPMAPTSSTPAPAASS